MYVMTLIKDTNANSVPMDVTMEIVELANLELERLVDPLVLVAILNVDRMEVAMIVGRALQVLNMTFLKADACENLYQNPELNSNIFHKS